METNILLTQFASTLFLTGLIWVTQLTQYPSFAWFSQHEFPQNHDKYRARIALIATPAMILEAVSGGLLIIYRPPSVGVFGAWFGMALIAVIWLSMFLIQVPLHERLSKGFDTAAIKRLVITNWIRTIAWTIRSAMLILWASDALKR